MLTPGNVGRLAKEEVTEYLRSTQEICSTYNLNKLNLKSQVDALKDTVSQLDDSLVYERKSGFTQELEILDQKRDDAFLAIRYGFLMHSYAQDLKKKAAGQLLLDHMDAFGNAITRLNYEAQSTILVNIIEDYDTRPELKSALELTGLTEQAKVVKETNVAFRDKYNERITSQSASEKLSFTAIKPKALEVYETLYDRIHALTVLDENDSYSKLNGELNTLAKRYLQIINTRNKGKEETPE